MEEQKVMESIENMNFEGPEGCISEDIDPNQQEIEDPENKIVSLHNKGQKEAIDAVTQYLGTDTVVKRLSLTLSKNNLQKEDAVIISKLLQQNKNIEEIILELNYNTVLGDEAGEIIVNGLIKNETLTKIELNLDMCDVGVLTGKALSALIEQKEIVTHLSLFLSENAFDDESTKQIFDSIIKNEKIQFVKLELWGNEISEETKQEIRDKIQDNEEKQQFQFGF